MSYMKNLRARLSERKQQSMIAREISYRHSAKNKVGKRVIQSMENLTGRPRLIRMAKDYEKEVEAGKDFWQVIIDRYGIGLNVLNGELDKIPKEGPLILIANHPFGILDGLVLGHILQKARGDFRILAHRVFRKAEDLDRVILPINFDETKEGVRQNLETRKEALRFLKDGGAIGIFPGGTVSTSAKPFSRPMDPSWRTFTAKMIQRSDAVVIPIYFHGSNSRLFQLASHMHYTLRMALLIREFRRRIKKDVPIAVGDPISKEEMSNYDNPRDLMEFLRQETYKLSPDPLKNYDPGFEFEEHWR
ncbi:MAG: lysophospholipid acyltransferase family protein [Pseudomonadota bacterium]